MIYNKWDFYPDKINRLGIVTRVEFDSNKVQHCTTARDMTRPCPLPEAFTINNPAGKRSDAWLRNTQENFGDILHSVLALQEKFAGKNIYIIGAAPTAYKYGMLLSEVKDGIIIAVNDGIRYVPNPYRDNVYFCCMDWLGATRWLEGFDIESMKAILCSITARDVWRKHGVHGRHWREVYWWANQCSFEANEFLAKNQVALPICDAGFSVVYSLLHVLALLKVKTISFLGVDGCFMDGEKYHGVPVEWSEGENLIVVPGINPQFPTDVMKRIPVISSIIYEITRDLIVGAAYFLKVNQGIRLINTSQFGTLSQALPHPMTIDVAGTGKVNSDVSMDLFEQRSLLSVIQELEGATPNTIPVMLPEEKTK